MYQKMYANYSITMCLYLESPLYTYNNYVHMGFNLVLSSNQNRPIGVSYIKD